LNWTPITRTAHYIDVQFSDEVGERSGSWKGGTIGCAYEMRPKKHRVSVLSEWSRSGASVDLTATE